MEQPTHWMFLGSIIVLAAFLHDELGSKSAAQRQCPRLHAGHRAGPERRSALTAPGWIKAPATEIVGGARSAITELASIPPG